MTTTGIFSKATSILRELRSEMESESTSIAEWLAMIAVFFLLLVAFKTGKLTKTSLVNDKDFFDTLSKIATAITVSAGATLAYIKFFKGRLLSPKLVILPTAGVIQSSEYNLHWIEVEIKNTGTVSIWNYAVEIKAKTHGVEEPAKEVTNFLQWDAGELGETSVDIGESSYEHAFLELPLTSVQAVTFQIAVYGNRGVRWTRCLTVPNPVTLPVPAAKPWENDV
jgi:hypothetical protein